MASRFAEWKFEFTAFCNAGGFWRFKLKSADIDTKIFMTNDPSIPPGLSQDQIDGASNCKALNTIEMALHRSALINSRLPETAYQCLQGGAPNPPKWTNEGDFEGFLGTYEHEKLHRERFESAMNDSFADFNSAVNALEMPIESTDTPNIAVERFKKSFILDDAVSDLKDAARLINFQNGGAHRAPEQFYQKNV